MDTNKKPLVSCLIPFYNHNHFIKHTLDSILEDTYPNKEIIIINDGSSDKDDSNITQWIQTHQEHIKIKYISRENQGLTKTLNELISLSNGKYILLCASDDYLVNNTIAKRVALLESNSTKLMLLSDAIVVDAQNNKLYDSSLEELYNADLTAYKNDDSLKKEILSHWSIAGATHLINKRLYQEVGLYDETLIVEDFDFFLRVIAKNYILFYDEKVSAYRLHLTNTSGDSTKTLAIKKDIYSSAIKHLSLFEEPYKSILQDKAANFLVLIKKEESLLKNLRKKTKRIRYKIKNLFKN